MKTTKIIASIAISMLSISTLAFADEVTPVKSTGSVEPVKTTEVKVTNHGQEVKKVVQVKKVLKKKVKVKKSAVTSTWTLNTDAKAKK